MEEHLAIGASVRSRQKCDVNAEGPGKILLNCEDKYGQQKYMQSLITKNEREEITNKIEKSTGRNCKILGKHV